VSAKRHELVCDNARRNRSYVVAGARPGTASKVEELDFLCPAHEEVKKATEQISRHRDYPQLVGLVHNVVTVCLKEQEILG